LNKMLKSILPHLKPGEMVMIEHDSISTPVFEVYRIGEYAMEHNIPLLIDDFLDSLYVYKTHLELTGINTEFLNDALVIKIGGINNVGNIVEKLSVEESSIHKKHYEGAFQKAINNIKSRDKFAFNLVLGIDKFLALLDTKMEILQTINVIASYLGNKHRIAFYFINRDLLKNSPLNVLSLLRSIPTTVVSIEMREKEYALRILKSINKEINGKEAQYSIENLLP